MRKIRKQDRSCPDFVAYIWSHAVAPELCEGPSDRDLPLMSLCHMRMRSDAIIGAQTLKRRNVGQLNG